MTTRREFLGSALVAASAAALPPTAFAQTHTGTVKTKDGIDIFVKDTGGKATAAGIAQAKMIEYHDGSHGIVLTERDRVTRDPQAFVAS